jgi:hypothetical protein
MIFVNGAPIELLDKTIVDSRVNGLQADDAG